VIVSPQCPPDSWRRVESLKALADAGSKKVKPAAYRSAGHAAAWPKGLQRSGTVEVAVRSGQTATSGVKDD